MMTKKYWKKKSQYLRQSFFRRLFRTSWGKRVYADCMPAAVLEMTMNCGDHLMTFSPTEYIGKKILRKGHFERDHVTRLLDFLKKQGLYQTSTVMLELGGNIGTQTVYFALSQAFKHIVSVEADPRNFKLLQRNIAQNNLQTQVTLLNVAAGENGGVIDFFQNQDNHGKSSAFRQSEFDKKISVPVLPVSEILSSVHVNPTQVGFIWMDIEGYEPMACQSMQELLSLKAPLYMEFSPLFYGTEKTKDFQNFLARYYQNCAVFHEDRIELMAVEDLPLGLTQFDVLFMK